MRRVVAAIVACFAILISGCAANQTNTTQLDGHWQLTWWNAPVTISDQPNTLSIAGKYVSGETPCNNFQATLTEDQGAIRIELSTITYVLCVDAEGTEFRYLDLIKQVRWGHVTGETLTLGAGNAQLLRFKPSAPS